MQRLRDLSASVLLLASNLMIEEVIWLRQSYDLRYFRTEIILWLSKIFNLQQWLNVNLMINCSISMIREIYLSNLDYLNRIVMCATLPPIRRYGLFLDVKTYILFLIISLFKSLGCIGIALSAANNWQVWFQIVLASVSYTH